ncbi:von Willebrand factor type A domain-containing protein [Aspergillus karnatakaensis]|uniref:VIT and vWA domain-containing protein n=1 Tax=Aspergillus karnatakaensis TaxID=1810916 RepID=UPI003CCD1B9F
MAAIPGIVFDAVEPPSPYQDGRSWRRLPPISYPYHYIGRNFAIPPSYGYQRQEPPKQPTLLPSFAVSLAISVTQGMAKAVVTQSFRNDAPENIEKGTYQFPLPHESSIVDFKCQIGATKTLQGVVKPRPEARNEFNHAVNAGRSAGLVEQDSTGVFKTELGNIPAHTTVEVKISFIFFLKYRLSDDETTTILTIPTYIAPRYGNPGFQVGVIGPQFDTKLLLEIDILAGNEICDVKSNTHHVVVEREIRQRRCQRWEDFISESDSPTPPSRSVSVRLDGDNDCLDRDFVLEIYAHPPVDKELPHATLEVHNDLEGSSAAMIEIPPSFMLRDQAPMEDTEVIFLADCSGSMLDKITGLKSSMQFFLRGLPRSRFNIYCFGSNFESLWPSSQSYGEHTLNQALHYVSCFSNDMGGTDLLPALQSVVAARGRGSLDVIVLTDGEVWQTQKTIEFVRTTCTQSEGSARFFALGIGNAVSHELVEGIAKAGGGYAEVIPTASSSGWEAQMIAVLRAAMTGHVTDITIEVEGLDLQQKGHVDKPPSILMSPGNIFNLSPFQRNRVFILSADGKLDENSQITIKRKSMLGQRIITYVPIHKLQERDSTVHTFATLALLNELERGESWIYRAGHVSRGTKQAQDMTKKEGERLGCQGSLVSKWTSFVAVETLEGDEPDKLTAERRKYAADTTRTQTTRNHTAYTQTTHVPSELEIEEEEIDFLASIPHSTNQVQTQRSHMGASTGVKRAMRKERARTVSKKQAFSLDFSAAENPEILENFDFDTFLSGNEDQQFGLDALDSSDSFDAPGHPAHGTGTAHARDPANKSRSIFDPISPESVLAFHPSTSNSGELPPEHSLRRASTSINASDSAGSRYTSLFSPEEVSRPQMQSLNRPPVQPMFQQKAQYSPQEYFEPLTHPAAQSIISPAQSMSRPSQSLSKAPQAPKSILKTTQTNSLSLPPEKTELQNKEAFVRQILQFQRSDGAFEGRTEEVEALDFGVYKIVQALLAKGAHFNVALTIVLVALLEAEFRRCRGLWLRMVEKAREYIQSELAPYEAETLTGIAEGMVKDGGTQSTMS